MLAPASIYVRSAQSARWSRAARVLRSIIPTPRPGSASGWRRWGQRLPESLTFAPVDFERDSFLERLATVGFDMERPAFFVWLGVTPHLTREAHWRPRGHQVDPRRVAFDYTEGRKPHEGEDSPFMTGSRNASPRSRTDRRRARSAGPRERGGGARPDRAGGPRYIGHLRPLFRRAADRRSGPRRPSVPGAGARVGPRIGWAGVRMTRPEDPGRMHCSRRRSALAEPDVDPLS